MKLVVYFLSFFATLTLSSFLFLSMDLFFLTRIFWVKDNKIFTKKDFILKDIRLSIWNLKLDSTFLNGLKYYFCCIWRR